MTTNQNQIRWTANMAAPIGSFSHIGTVRGASRFMLDAASLDGAEAYCVVDIIDDHASFVGLLHECWAWAQAKADECLPWADQPLPWGEDGPPAATRPVWTVQGLEQTQPVTYKPGEVEFLELQTQIRLMLDRCDLITSDLTDLVNAAIRYGRSL